MADCPICGEELSEHDHGIEKWDDDSGTGGFIVREMVCDNEECPLFEEQQDWFFEFERVDVGGDEINIKKLKEQFEKKKGE